MPKKVCCYIKGVFFILTITITTILFLFLMRSLSFFSLFFTELKAEILGPGDLYVKSGSDINLTCKIPRGSHEQGNIFWYKGKKKKKKKSIAE